MSSSLLIEGVMPYKCVLKVHYAADRDEVMKGQTCHSTVFEQAGFWAGFTCPGRLSANLVGSLSTVNKNIDIYRWEGWKRLLIFPLFLVKK